MSQANHAYYLRPADEEQANARRAKTLEAKTAHQQLRDLYFVQFGLAITGPKFRIHTNAGA